MATFTYAVTANGTDLTPYLTEYKVARNKIAREANRNLAGTLKTTWIGTFPKITLGFKQLTQAELSAILTILDDTTITVSWWDEESDTYKGGTFYAGDFDYGLFSTETLSYKPFTATLIPYSKMV